MTKRDLAILTHLGLYRLSLRPILARLFFANNETSLANVLKRLREDGLVEVRSGLPGNMSYYQLTVAGTKHIGVPTDRASTFERQAFDRHLAIVWFCCAESERRFRVPDDDLASLLPGAPEGDCCLSQHKGHSRLLRVYTPAAKTKPANLKRHIRELAETMITDPSTEHRVQSRSLGLEVLVHSDGQRKDLNMLLRKPKAGVTLASKMYCHVSLVPSVSTLAGMIHALRNNSND